MQKEILIQISTKLNLGNILKWNKICQSKKKKKKKKSRLQMIRRFKMIFTVNPITCSTSVHYIFIDTDNFD